MRHGNSNAVAMLRTKEKGCQQSETLAETVAIHLCKIRASAGISIHTFKDKMVYAHLSR